MSAWCVTGQLAVRPGAKVRVEGAMPGQTSGGNPPGGAGGNTAGKGKP